MEHKNFIYNLVKSQHKGYKLLVEQNNFSHYCRLNYDGFKILNIRQGDYVSTICFRISAALIRKIKLMSLSNELVTNSTLFNLFELLNKSKEDADGYSSEYYCTATWVSGSVYLENENDFNNQQKKLARLNYNKKYKNENKKRFCK